MKRTVLFLLLLGISLVLTGLPTALSYATAGPGDAHGVMGQGVGVNPGRVVWCHHPDSVDWDGSGYWWNTGNFHEEIVYSMVNDTVAELAGSEDAATGWDRLFTYQNEKQGVSKGYTKGERIAIKANMNGSGVFGDDATGETAMSYTNPVLLKCLLTSLVREAGVEPGDITVYDVSRQFPGYMVDMCTMGELAGVNFVDRFTGEAGEPIVWSYDFQGDVNYLPTCVTEADYLINLANLKGHSYGVTLCGKNHFGSFLNTDSLRPPEGANLHQFVASYDSGIYSPLVDFMANRYLGQKTVLYMLDALICAPSEGASITVDNSTWQQAPFNGDFTSSIFASQDPIAIDSVGYDFLINEPTVTGRNSAVNKLAAESYLHEGAQVTNPPSGTAYMDGAGVAAVNLGVHEHWNNATDKKYSRNLGADEGIELVQVNSGAILGDADYSGRLSSNDAAIILHLALFGNDVNSSLDVDGDNRLTANDSALVLQRVLDGDMIFPVEKGTGTEETTEATTEATEAITEETTEATTEAVLVVYFSRTGNTRAFAESIYSLTGGHMGEIVPVNPYPEVYSQVLEQAREELSAGILPEIEPIGYNVDDYDTIILGYPIWFNSLPPVVQSFLSENQQELKGKTIMPFCTSGGSGISGSLVRLRELCPDSVITSGLEDNDTSAINSWLDEAGL